MNIMSGDEAVNNEQKHKPKCVEAKGNKPKEKIRVSATKKQNYEEYFSLTDIRLVVVEK
jgi:hypothetical protein